MQTNYEFELARQFIENTSENLFLTGKAGTGKTTFLKNLRENSYKRIIVVAPTGIAAMNAGGVTIHSFFQLSFAPFIPDTKLVQKSFYKFSKEKINIIRSLNLLVIDEISMVRADLLDAVDDVLRRYRDREKPFGGVQLLMIGDMQQLAPVVKEDEWQLLKNHYENNFFFSSHALQKTTYLTIELKQIYRQTDAQFLQLLNQIRTSQADEETLKELNKRYIPGFSAQKGYITLTTHNYQAQKINEQRLNALPGEIYKFNARIEGDFPDYLYPVDNVLVLKQGAQIMFVKNDSSGKSRYFNGKIGTITRISQQHIEVRGEGDGHSFIIEPEKWQNNQYTLNNETKEIVEKELGSFLHYPIKLAWAITIHKSQGLTFEHAIIDARASFAHGQVYVALSRCKTLEGMVLSSPLSKNVLISDQVITNFTNKKLRYPNENDLYAATNRYYYELVKELFDFESIEKTLNYFTRLLDEHFYLTYSSLISKYKIACEDFKTQIAMVAGNFYKQYTQLIIENISTDGKLDVKLRERISSGATYFYTKLENIVLKLLLSTKIDTDNKEIGKRVSKFSEELMELLRVKLYVLKHSTEDFSINSYLAAKSKANIQEKEQKEKKVRTQKDIKLEVSEDILHPELYHALKAWRDEEAKKFNQPVYTIIQQKAILGITNLLPITKEKLQRIPYMGKKSVDKYGDIILDYVNQYLQKKGIDIKDSYELF